MTITTRYTDAHEFTTKSGLCRKAGVSENQLLPVIVKELTDNALDAVEAADGDTSSVSIGLLPERNGFFVEDGAGGFSPEALLEFWRVDRGYTSSKRFRLPTRGALGNGLRVVAGAVVAFEAELTVHTRGVQYRIQPRPDGAPLILEEGDSSLSRGTRVEIVFPESTSINEGVLSWGRGAIKLSGGGRFKGRTSPHWYGARDLHEIFTGTTGETVAAVVGQFAGCSGAKAGKIAEGYDRIPANEITLEDAGILLSRMQEAARPFKHENMPRIGGETRFSTGEYTTAEGLKIPFSVSLWVELSEWGDLAHDLIFTINRTPTMARSYMYRDGKNTQALVLAGYRLEVTSQRELAYVVNISSPLIPYTSDGKEPNLSKIISTGIVEDTITKAADSIKRQYAEPKGKRITQKDAVFSALPKALGTAGGGYAFSQRQVYYAIRPLLEFEPKYGYFTELLTEYENEFGEVAGLYRDNRGALILPHSQDEMPVGTLTVASFKRPLWSFNRLLFIEKQGFFPLLKSAKWGERWDCALISSSGFASRAVKDLIDALAEGAEPLEIFAVHDADAAGTMIYQSLAEATKTRGARKVRIHNLGLEVEEALSMGLQPENLGTDCASGKKPVADYVPERWRRWLQKNRVELNSMTTPQFLTWLDAKMEQATGEPPKLIPPESVLREQLTAELRERIHNNIAARILKEARINERVEEALASAVYDSQAVDLRGEVEGALAEDRSKSWREPLSSVACKLAGAVDF